MDKLVDIAKKRLNQHKLGSSARAAHVLYTTQQFLKGQSEESLKVVRPLMLKQGVLWLRAPHPSVAQEFQGVVPVLLRKLQGQYGDHLIQKIRVKMS